MLAHRPSSAQKSPRPLDSTQRLAKAKALDCEIKDLHRRRNKDRVLLVARLAALKEARGYLSLGFPSVQAYAKSRLGWGAGKVKALLSLTTRLPQRPLLREAFEAGELDWTKAVLACRAAEHAPEREAEWLRAAGELSSRQLEAKVAEASGVSELLRRAPQGASRRSRANQRLLEHGGALCQSRRRADRDRRRPRERGSRESGSRKSV